MLNKQKHQLILTQILKDISSDSTISPIIGFKGGTCAFLFYDLPRFSVDLDFDLLSSSIQPEIIAKKLRAILRKYGIVKDLRVKRYTIFSLVSYGDTDHNIKIEINTRDSSSKRLADSYEIRKHLGISLLVATKEHLFASKIVALLGRSSIAMRDIYDIHYFAKNIWPIDIDFVKKKSGQNMREYLDRCIQAVEKIPDNAVLIGLGELLDAKQKSWVKKSLKTDTAFLLRSYGEVYKTS